jgi:hypothetical protein
MRRLIFAALLLTLSALLQAPVDAQAKRGVKQEENRAVASNQSDGGEKVFSPKEVETKAVIKSRPLPSSLGGSSKEAITITLRAVFRKTGEVTDVTVYKVAAGNLPDKEKKFLVKACVEAAQKIKFVPAMKEGHPVSQYIQIEYNISPVN